MEELCRIVRYLGSGIDSILSRLFISFLSLLWRVKRCEFDQREIRDLTMLCRWTTSTLAIPLIAGLMPGVLLDAAAEAQLADRPPSLAGIEAFSAPLNEGNA
jgi:hypothetical protein